MSGAAGIVDREPFFIAAISRRNVRPSLSAIERAPHVVKERLQQAEIEE